MFVQHLTEWKSTLKKHLFSMEYLLTLTVVIFFLVLIDAIKQDRR
jgi:adenine specific DNA methylase Mod